MKGLYLNMKNISALLGAFPGPSAEAIRIAEECDRKIQRIAAHRRDLTIESIVTRLNNYAHGGTGSWVRYLEQAERAAVRGEALPWESEQIFDTQDLALLACRPSQHKTMMTQNLALEALKDRKP